MISFYIASAFLLHVLKVLQAIDLGLIIGQYNYNQPNFPEESLILSVICDRLCENQAFRAKIEIEI